MSANNHKFVDRDFNSSVRPTNIPNLFAKQEIPTDFNIIQKMLNEELNTSILYKNAWEIAETEFRKKKKSTPQYFTSSTADECYVALIACTLDEPCLYEDFNRQFIQLTDVASWIKFPYKSLFFLLKLSKKENMNEPIYRAISTHFSSDLKVGDLFYFDYFASCSTNQSIVQNAAGLNGTIIELQNGAWKGIRIRNYSLYPEENEVLVFPSNKFKVAEFSKSKAIPRLVLTNIPLRGKRFIDTEFSSIALPYDVPNPFANKKDFHVDSEDATDIDETSGTGIRRRRHIPLQSSYSTEVPYNFSVVKKILEEELSNDEVYAQTWKMAEETFQVKKQSLSPEYFSLDIPDECYIAVIAYTINTTKLYRKFNTGFRMLTDEESWKAFPYKSLYYLLTLVVPGVVNDPDPSRDLYRGIRYTHFNPEPVVGSLFYYGYFASHTVDLATAIFYLKGNGTLVKVIGGAKVAIGISKYSMFEDEDEVLVFPKNQFTIKEFRKDENPGIDVLVLQWAGIVSNL